MSILNKNEIFLLEEIVKKNFSSKYKDSILGILWTVLQPLLMMILFTIVFSTLFNRNIEFFEIYFLCGWCFYIFFSSAISLSMNSLKANKNILQRTPAPKHIFILGSVISELLNLLIMIFLLLVVMFIMGVPFQGQIMIFSIIPVISLFIMIVGLGLMLSVVCVYYSDILHLWSVLSMMFMYASATFYPMDIVPEPFHKYLILNPLYWVIDQFRCLIYQGVIPQTTYIINSLLLSSIILVIGIIIFKKYENKVTMRF